MKIKKEINFELIEKKAQDLGYNHTDISRKLKVSRQMVSKWLNKISQPSPNKLLQLANLLNVPFNELVKIEYVDKPLVLFRKNMTSKTTEKDKKKGVFISSYLEKVLPYIKHDTFSKPVKLLNPKKEYDYIQNVVTYLRNKALKLENNSIGYEELISLFSKYNTILIPVLWGKRDDHINAMTIYLKETMSSFVFLNLDTKTFDFKFWMAHELGHVLTTDLEEQEAENFADDFAGALLYPDNLASSLYSKLQEHSDYVKVQEIFGEAKKYIISPNTIYKRINSFAYHNDKPLLDLDKIIYPRITLFNKNYKLYSEFVFGNKNPDAVEYLKFAKDYMNTNFFDGLKLYIHKNKKSATFIKDILDIGYIDAQNLYEEI